MLDFFIMFGESNQPNQQFKLKLLNFPTLSKNYYAEIKWFHSHV